MWMPPQGVSRHYAPLAILSFEDERKVWDCRRRFKSLAVSPSDEEDTIGYDDHEPRSLLYLVIDGVRHALHDLLTIGRQEENDITIAQDTVSRRQAEVARTEEGATLRVYDYVTNDNTYRNDEFVPRGQRVRLQPGDKLYFGDKEVEVVEEEADEER